MRPDHAPTDLTAELVFDRLLGGEELDAVQELLMTAAPRWSSRLRIWKSARDQVPVDMSESGALARAVLVAAGERGETYRALTEELGPPPFDRFAGSVELRGAGPELIVVLSVDQMILSPLGETLQLGNDIALQVGRPKVERAEGSAWLSQTFETMCGALSPAWGSARHPGEYWAKVMSDDYPIRAVGRDFGRRLPGVFWLNFYGRRYRELVGADRLRTTPAERVTEVDDGVLVMVAPDPKLWDAPEYASAEQKVRDHLGTELFFSKADPDRLTVAPDWEA